MYTNLETHFLRSKEAVQMMKSLKQRLFVLMAALMVVGFSTGCSNNTETETEIEENETEGTETENGNERRY